MLITTSALMRTIVVSDWLAGLSAVWLQTSVCVIPLAAVRNCIDGVGVWRESRLDAVSHAHRAIDDRALEHDDALGVDVAVNGGAPLNLASICGRNGSDNGTCQDNLTGV